MNSRPNVMIVAYIFPPIGGGGVPRPLKMAKYLGEFGWGVHVLTADPAYHATLDQSLLAQLPNDVAIHRAKEFSLLQRSAAAAAGPATAQAGGPSPRPSFATKAKRAIISMLKKVKPYLMIPDDQILWYPEAVKRGREVMKTAKIDVIFSTSGPVTNHLVAQKLAEEFGCRWIADFRDPWTQNMHRSGIAWRERLEERMEARVMSKADAITTVTATFAENFRKKYGERIKRMELIYNGFDQADFRELAPAEVPEANGKLHGVYAGILYQKRNPRLLLRAIRELIDEGKVAQDDLLLTFAGVFDYPGYSENADCVKELNLESIVRIVGNLPHKEALQLMKAADFQLLIGDVSADAGAYIPGKLYEYMGIGKPILALNMAGEATEIIQRFELGQVANPTDKLEIKEAFYRLYQDWKAKQSVADDGSVSRSADFFDRVKPYERREQARQLAHLMDELVQRAYQQQQLGES
ncbi:glycosyltransferase family 4 protein [Brevibacillus migulae]|uniref:glycosyltransferase family 4 protein n=1 Tax=Brevibacillus migulae TaxID=1644114 RepID=UPI00106EB20F|nr:glycosyltransferase family 4 protein [Brevibacillus migulae]